MDIDRSRDLKNGVEKHVWPAGNGRGIVTKNSSDSIFGADGLGLANTVWMRILSFLARTGIQDQTGSKKGETDIENCVQGWGQGAYSSRVFDVERGVNKEQLATFIDHLNNIAEEMNVPNGRITEKVLGAFIATQEPEPYSTIDGIREVESMRGKLQGIFRGHVQWQGFIALCGHVDKDGVVHVTPELLTTFFNSPHPFFELIVNHRRDLRAGSVKPGESSEILRNAPTHIDRAATDLRYKTNKSGLMIILRIAKFMLLPYRAKVGPLLRERP